MISLNKLNIRLTHPNLYRSMMTFALINTGLGLNFIFTNPTFNPFMIDKTIVGSIFLVLGISKFIFLNFYRRLRLVRLTITLSIMGYIFWGLGTSITFFQGKTSLQLFTLYIGLALLNVFQLIEPAINSTNEVKQTDE